MNESVDSVSSTSRPTLTSSSFDSLSRICLDVTYFPDLPANGEEFTMKFIESVGSSISIVPRDSGWSGSQMVSPIDISEIPDTTTMSPDPASGTATRLRPLYTKI